MFRDKRNLTCFFGFISLNACGWFLLQSDIQFLQQENQQRDELHRIQMQELEVSVVLFILGSKVKLQDRQVIIQEWKKEM